MSVVEPPIDWTDPAFLKDALDCIGTSAKAGQTRANEYLEGIAAQLEKEGLRVSTTVRVGGPVETILEQTRDPGASLVVMATNGRTSLGRLFLGSVAQEVVHRALVPVLLVHPT